MNSEVEPWNFSLVATGSSQLIYIGHPFILVVIHIEYLLSPEIEQFDITITLVVIKKETLYRGTL